MNTANKQKKCSKKLSTAPLMVVKESKHPQLSNYVDWECINMNLWELQNLIIQYKRQFLVETFLLDKTVVVR